MKQITEDYVSYENAVLLKEKGFDELCFALYNPEKELIQCGVKLSNTQVGRVPGSYSAPTHQMALKWLREVHKLYINIGKASFYWNYGIYDIKNKNTNLLSIRTDFSSYEQAVEAALKYSLENLI